MFPIIFGIEDFGGPYYPLPHQSKPANEPEEKKDFSKLGIKIAIVILSLLLALVPTLFLGNDFLTKYRNNMDEEVIRNCRSFAIVVQNPEEASPEDFEHALNSNYTISYPDSNNKYKITVRSEQDIRHYVTFTFSNNGTIINECPEFDSGYTFYYIIMSILFFIFCFIFSFGIIYLLFHFVLLKHKN